MICVREWAARHSASDLMLSGGLVREGAGDGGRQRDGK